MPARSSIRRRRGLVVLLALLPLLIAFPAGARAGANVRIWVSPRGSDANPGSKAAPLASLPAAQKAVRKSLRLQPKLGVSVILRGGTYRLAHPLKLTAADSGPGGAMVSYRAYQDERPVISGAARVPGSAWKRYDTEANIWRAKVGDVSTRELYVNGERATRAASGEYPAGFRPNWNGGGTGSGIEYLPTIAPGGLNPASWGNPAEWSNPEDVEAVILTQWKTMTVPVSSIVPASGSTPGLLKMAEPAWKNANVFRGPDGQPGIWSFWQVTRFENALQFLDSPGEWYLDEKEGWLYYKPQPWQNLRGADVELPLRQALVRGRGSAKRPIRNVEFRGLTFTCATWLQPSGENGYISDQGGFHLVGEGHEPNTIGHDPNDTATPGNVSIRFGRNVRFLGDRFAHLGAVGLSLGTGSQHDLVRGNTFTDVSSSALQLERHRRRRPQPDQPGPAQPRQHHRRQPRHRSWLGIPGRARDLHRLLQRHPGHQQHDRKRALERHRDRLGMGAARPRRLPGAAPRHSPTVGPVGNADAQPQRPDRRQHDQRLPRPALGRRRDLHHRRPGHELRKRAADRSQRRSRQAGGRGWQHLLHGRRQPLHHRPRQRLLRQPDRQGLPRPPTPPRRPAALLQGTERGQLRSATARTSAAASPTATSPSSKTPGCSPRCPSKSNSTPSPTTSSPSANLSPTPQRATSTSAPTPAPASPTRPTSPSAATRPTRRARSHRLGGDHLIPSSSLRLINGMVGQPQ